MKWQQTNYEASCISEAVSFATLGKVKGDWQLEFATVISRKANPEYLSMYWIVCCVFNTIHEVSKEKGGGKCPQIHGSWEMEELFLIPNCLNFQNQKKFQLHFRDKDWMQVTYTDVAASDI